MDGDFSRTTPQVHTLFPGNGASLAEEPEEKGRKDGYSPSGYPRRTPVVLATPRKGASEPEYRVGMVTADDFSTGLSCRNHDKRRLSAVMARKCFGASRVYYDKQEALADARQDLLPLASCGIKVLHFNDAWPGIACSLVE
jgi:hypothetical protein